MARLIRLLTTGLFAVACSTVWGQSGGLPYSQVPRTRQTTTAWQATRQEAEPEDPPIAGQPLLPDMDSDPPVDTLGPDMLPVAEGFKDERPVRVRSRLFGLPEERYRGRGQPLIQESWRYRPLSVTGVVGFVQGSPLIRDWLRESQGMMGGFQLGWDCDHYWGLATRFAWGKVEVVDSQRAIEAQVAKDDAAGLPPNDPFRHRFDGRRYNRVFFWDAHAEYYPWGDSALRPFLMAGVGATAMSFIDRTDVSYKDTLFTLPVGAGLKYRLGDFLALRMECADYMGFGGGSTLELTHHLLVTAGMDIRFGGSRRAYWPWNPTRHYW